MNSLTLYLEEHKNDSELLKHGIHFKNSIFIKMLIDGEDIEELDGFEDALVVFEELRKSTESSGKYLIFTCACGVAEDGGWEGVDVSIDGDNVKWEFEVGDKFYRYIFDKNEYLAEVQSIITPIEKTDLQIEPRSVIYPENFVR